MSERIRRGEPLSPALDVALRAMTPLQRLGMWLRKRQEPVRVKAHVVSIGNLTAGGTGKTPAVIHFARRAIAAEERVAVLTRGYGSVRTPEPLVLEEDPFAPGLFQRFGDEPVLIARKVPELTVIKDRDRVRGAQRAMELGCNFLLLDDGYQHLRLRRHENILLIDATNPFGNGQLIPAGILREPISAAERATEILLTRCDQAKHIDALVERLRKVNPKAPIRKTRHAPRGLWRVRDGEILPLEELRGRPTVAACAIASPERFVETLHALGAQVTRLDAYPDHEAFTPLAPADQWVITTEKDAVRMVNPPDNVYALEIALEEIPAQEHATLTVPSLPSS